MAPKWPTKGEKYYDCHVLVSSVFYLDGSSLLLDIGNFHEDLKNTLAFLFLKYFSGSVVMRAQIWIQHFRSMRIRK
jgi:hypothetical protein